MFALLVEDERLDGEGLAVAWLVGEYLLAAANGLVVLLLLVVFLS